MVANKIDKNAKIQGPPKVRKLCVCESIKPALVICRIFGMFPITTRHDKDNNCIFEKDGKWLIYSVVLTVFCFIRTLFGTEFFNILEIGRSKSLHPILSSLNDILYCFYVTVLTALNIYRYPKFVETLNRITPIVKESLYCQSSRRSVLTVQYGVLFVFLTIIFIKYSAIIYVHMSESYETSHFTFKIYSNALTQAEIFTIYVMFIATTSILMGTLGCYEKFALSCFEFVRIHPLKEIEETNNVAEFMGLVDYTLCAETHPRTRKVEKFSLSEIVEYLRCLHEDVCIVMYEMNNCLNPQFLVHVVVELTVLIMGWYAVIMYVAYTFLSPIAATIHFLNIIFVVVHTLGLLVFLKQAQQLENLVRDFIHLLLEYSTKITTPDEHQQVRIFVEKMKGQRPLTASGVFDINLGIAGPVCANILTYVLVALQFDVPKT